MRGPSVRVPPFSQRCRSNTQRAAGSGQGVTSEGQWVDGQGMLVMMDPLLELASRPGRRVGPARTRRARRGPEEGLEIRESQADHRDRADSHPDPE